MFSEWQASRDGLTGRSDIRVDGPVDGAYFTDINLFGNVGQPRLFKGGPGKEGDGGSSDVAQKRVDTVVDCMIETSIPLVHVPQYEDGAHSIHSPQLMVSV